ncbi:ATP-binding cassette domain-containing protein [Sorangium sp. So ce233]|uniref:ATP-binding cassette domain-containing protein n=1 Tax=Sorangium sp. So ce233 TaxID=3133290 RepID=UPI003F617253
MPADLDAVAWPAARAGEAVESLAILSGLSSEEALGRAAPSPPPPPGAAIDDDALGAWIDAAAEPLGVEAEPVTAEYPDIGRFVRSCGPALIRLPGGQRGLLAVLGRRWGRVRVVRPDRRVVALRPEDIARVLRGSLEDPGRVARIERVLAEAGIAGRRRGAVRDGIVRERLAQRRLGGSWLLRLAPSRGFLRHARGAGLHRRFAALAGAHALRNALRFASWWILGRAALAGRFDPGWFAAWAGLLLSMVPLRAYEVWTQGVIAIDGARLLKQRLLHGVLELDPDELRTEGNGQLLGRVLESQAVESLALGGGFGALFFAIELVMAAVVLALGAGGAARVALLAAWVALAAVVGRRYLARYRAWTEARLRITDDLVERMSGHRTRLAQEVPERWHLGEDEALAGYHARSRALDAASVALLAIMPGGWTVVGLVGLWGAFAAGGLSAGGLAVAVGGILLAGDAILVLAEGLYQFAAARVAWTSASPLFHAASRPRLAGALSPAELTAGEGGAEGPLLDVRGLVVRHRGRAEPVLRGCDLAIRAGDRLALSGPSGSGKTTLAAVLTSLRRPASGVVLLRGLDLRTWGSSGWRQRIVAAPQFHENHILSETLAFNLLMGRRWPPRREDLEEAEEVCRALGLAELLDRMPSGLQQMVGDTGWQLSHGERSRVYIARALLQRADLVIFDESFGSLDPDSLRRVVGCVLERARTVLVIAHA